MIKLICWIINNLLSKLNILVIFRYGKSIGDQLCISSLLGSIKKKRKNIKIILIINYTELFYNNPDIYLLLAFKKNKISYYFFKILEKIKGKSIKEFRSKYNEIGDSSYLEKIQGQHIIRAMSYSFTNIINIDEIDIKNKFYFSKNEIKKMDSKFILPNKFVLIQSEGKKDYCTLKQWKVCKFQKVINNFPEFKWIQIGLNSEHKFENVIDLRSKTSLRELGYIFSKANFLLTNEGFFSHFSSCFDLKTFVIFSGTSMTDNLTYSNIINIQKINNLDCYPCYLKNNCTKDKQLCMENISSSDVVDIIKKNISF